MDKPWFAFYDKGVPHRLDYPDIPLYGLLEEAAKRFLFVSLYSSVPRA